MLVDRARWTEFFEDYVIDDCAVLDASRVFFVLYPERDETDDGHTTRLLYARAGRALDDKRFLVNHVDFGRCAIAFGPARVEFVVVGLTGAVFRYDATTATIEAGVPRDIEGSDLGAVVNGITCVGRTLYAYGWPHRVWRRDGPEVWTALANGWPAPPALRSSDDIVAAIHSRRIRALAGFGDDDLYAVGDGGDVWHWNGATWVQRPFPTRETLIAACVGGDRVFIADRTGHLWSGRGRQWSSVAGPAPYPFEDLAWFDNRLWCGAANGGLSVLERGRLERANLPGAVAPGANRLSVAPDGTCLVAAGRWGAALHDGTAWRVKIGAPPPAPR